SLGISGADDEYFRNISDGTDNMTKVVPVRRSIPGADTARLSMQVFLTVRCMNYMEIFFFAVKSRDMSCFVIDPNCGIMKLHVGVSFDCMLKFRPLPPNILLGFDWPEWFFRCYSVECFSSVENAAGLGGYHLRHRNRMLVFSR